MPDLPGHHREVVAASNVCKHLGDVGILGGRNGVDVPAGKQNKIWVLMLVGGRDVAWKSLQKPNKQSAKKNLPLLGANLLPEDIPYA